MKPKVTMIVLASALALVAASDDAHAASRVKIGEMTVNGLTVVDVDCALTGGGFMAGAVLMNALAKQKHSIDRCGRRGQATRVSFTLGGKKLGKINALASSKRVTGVCVTRILKKVRSKLSGRCTMTLLSGPKKAALKAARKLPKG